MSLYGLSEQARQPLLTRLKICMPIYVCNCGHIGKEVADNSSILYGGAANLDAAELLGNRMLNGGLIGGSSLSSFIHGT